jgi:hypothetical protein
MSPASTNLPLGSSSEDVLPALLDPAILQLDPLAHPMGQRTPAAPPAGGPQLGHGTPAAPPMGGPKLDGSSYRWPVFR